MIDTFYRAGSLVFGGGHVVLPLLRSGVVPPGWISDDAFLAGYGAAQAVPGPLFSFAGYLGTLLAAGPGGIGGALICLVAIFLPAWLLIGGALPFWETLRRLAWTQSALRGTNAAVVGVLLAALYDPVWKEGVSGPREFALAIAAFAALALWNAPPWAVVIACAVGGAAVL
jgi:chromate transporter